MADIEASSTEARIWRLQPGTAEEAQSLELIARWHLQCLPETASSKAGLESVCGLYRAVLHDPHGIVLWSPEGAFCSATLSLRETEKEMRGQLPWRIKLKLATFNLMKPHHLLSRFCWDSTVPRERAGYILTIGSLTAVRSESGERAKGLGTRLLSAAERTFQEQGASESWVDTSVANIGARKFYKKNGYLEVKSAFSQVLLKKDLST